MKILRISLFLLIVAGLVAGAWLWSSYRGRHPATNDAYIQANTVNISSQVSGQVAAVLVKSFQAVKKGEVLLRLDDSNYRLAAQRAEAQVALVDDQTLSAQARVSASKAQAAASRQQQANAALENQRTQKLIAKGVITHEQADDASFKLKEAQAAASAASATITAVQAEGKQASAQLRVAQLNLAQAQLDLSRTVITAPADGILGEVGIQPGDFVDTGEDLFPLVNSSSYWVAANFKETDLERIKPGQAASIELDMYPRQNYEGTVESVSPASGAAFSLIPAQNASGNWVKVTQRFPVRIKIKIQHQDNQLPLRLGASTSVTIDTTAALHQTVAERE